MNLLMKEMPEKISNVAKGLLFIVVAFPLAFLVFVLVSVTGWLLSDGSSIWITMAVIIAAIVFIIQLSYGIYVIMQKTDRT